MAEAPFTTIKVYVPDAKKLGRVFGTPQWRAFHLALAKAGCEHPEGLRKYTTALMRADGEPLNQTETAELVTLSGFRCGACEHYVFQGQVMNDTEPQAV